MEKDIRLVLSSGGARGLAQIGAIQSLEQHGFRIKSVCGSSIGAVIGGLYAMDKLDDYTKWIKTLDKSAVWGLMDFALTGKGLIKGEKVFDKMKTFIPDVLIEDMEIPYVAVATDVLNRKEMVFDQGSFYDAARASIAIPALITPVHHLETILVDGGVLNPIPFDHIKPVESSLLVVVNLYGPIEGKYAQGSESENEDDEDNDRSGFLNSLLRIISTSDKKSLGYIGLLTTISTMMLSKIAQLSIRIHQPDIVINVPGDSASTFEFFKADELISLGKKLSDESISHYLTEQNA
ncbi:MAG TPA: patatin-like phospholipase family protein [Saprospiraceae bacterium]|nr:patatin-like phospholipase family protein [Saprospiraceae bacterium]